MRFSFIYWLKLLIRLNSSFYDQMENWLEGFGFAGQSLTNKNFSGYNLRGCDFSEGNLQRVNFEKVVGGFSWVRPAIVLITIAFSIRVIITLPPLPPMVLPETIHMPDQIGTCFYTLLAITLFLKLVLVALYSRKLPPRKSLDKEGQPHTKQAICTRHEQPIKGCPSLSALLVTDAIAKSTFQTEQNFWQQIKAASQAVLAIAPPYFAFGCYTFAQATLLVESLTDKLLLFIFAALFGVAAVSFFIWTVGEVFIFRSSFAGANLSNASFAGARLLQCNFKKANLYCANLQASDLRKSNFKEADLRFADLRGANLRGANLKNARIDGAIGLQEALHAQST